MKRIDITVANGWLTPVSELPLQVDEGTSLASLLSRLPPVDKAAAITVWGQRPAPDYELREGDRVEILRPLLADPKEARRQRARGRPR